MIVYITVGISASGKTTWADDVASSMCAHGYNVEIISRDDIRREILGDFDGSLWDHWKFTKEAENQVTEKWNSKFTKALAVETDYIILADTNLNPVFRNKIIDQAQKAGAIVKIQGFSVPLDVAISRDANRLDSVGEDVIRKQYAQWEKYVNEKSCSV